MARRRIRRSFDEDAETKKLVYISVTVAIIAVLFFIITYVVYSNVVSSKTKVGSMESKITEYSNAQKEQSSQTSSSMGKTVNEMVEQEKKEEVEKIAINTSNIVKEEKEAKENEIEEEEIISKEEPEKEEKQIPEPTFIKPVNGEILREFAKENLVYSETLKEWVTHFGVDIKSEKTSIVKASSDGTIKAIKNDPRYGITVVMEHPNGFTSVYSNLFTAEFVKEGEEIKQGQTIGTVGNTAMFEILDESHLHFEILKDGEYLNPSEYIK